MSGQEPEWPTCEECVYFCEFNCRRYAPRPITDRRVWMANERIGDIQQLQERRMPDGTMKQVWVDSYPLEYHLFPEVSAEQDGVWRVAFARWRVLPGPGPGVQGRSGSMTAPWVRHNLPPWMRRPGYTAEYGLRIDDGWVTVCKRRVLG